MDNTIITEKDIINTYDRRQQEQCRLYYKYHKIKKENPELGYKSISEILGQPHAKTRWWHCGKYTPTPVQTVNWLKGKSLIPLALDNPQLPIIARIVGATFSDGGIFGNLNGIFLSSSELISVEDFGKDLEIIFGSEISKNSRIIESGEYGHSWCYQNTNRNIIRFFQALGSPIGRKSRISLKVPNWIFGGENTSNEFLGSIVGGDGGIPKYIYGNPNPIDIGITGRDALKENRIEFLEQIRKILTRKGIETNKIYINKWRDTNIFRLPTRSTKETFLIFNDEVKINYCYYKKKKLENTIRAWLMEGKLRKFLIQ